MAVEGQVELRFRGHVVRTGNHVNLSAVRVEGEHLWLAGDETATVERLVLDSAVTPTRGDDQHSFALADLVELPGAADDEADIEGLARSGGDLWVIGSHSLVRKRAKPHHPSDKALRRLAKVRRDPNRFVLARLAVQPGADGRPELVRVARDGRRSAVAGAPGAENLCDLLVDDPHLAPFLAIPSKDNGLDVEGIAVHGESLYVGLRGPALRGWAVVLEVLPCDDPGTPGRLVFGPFPDGTRYRKHLLDLGGLGVRDLCPDGADLLVLAGPSMALSGPVRVHRWRERGAGHVVPGGARSGDPCRVRPAARGGRGPRGGDRPARGRLRCSWCTTARRRGDGPRPSPCSPTASASTSRSPRRTTRPSHHVRACASRRDRSAIFCHGSSRDPVPSGTGVPSPPAPEPDVRTGRRSGRQVVSRHRSPSGRQAHPRRPAPVVAIPGAPPRHAAAQTAVRNGLTAAAVAGSTLALVVPVVAVTAGAPDTAADADAAVLHLASRPERGGRSHRPAPQGRGTAGSSPSRSP